MKKFICSVCGYVYEGEEAPEKCPQCGAPKDKFTVMGEGKKEYADEHVLGCLLYTSTKAQGQLMTRNVRLQIRSLLHAYCLLQCLGPFPYSALCADLHGP